MADITITEGDTLEVDYNLENTGDGTGTFDPRLLIQGVQEDQDTGITLDPAQTATGTLSWPTESGDAVTDALAEVVTDDTSDSITVTVESAIPNSGISQEEDGDLTEYAGDVSFFSATSSPTISGSDYAISFSTDGTPVYAETTFSEADYSQLSMYVYPEDANNELLFVDSDNGNVVFGIYFRAEGYGIYYSGSDAGVGSVTNAGATSRDGGTELVASGDVVPQYYHIEFLNIDYQSETLDIAVEGSTVVTDEPFILSGTADTFQINSNYGSAVTRGYADKVDTGE
jgi:hypothetical protein